MFLSEWMEKTRDERRNHLDLTTPCDLPSSLNGRTGKEVLGSLLELLGLTNDLASRSKTGMVLHACGCDSNRGGCRNPQHLYFGTFSENMQDIPEEDRRERARKCAVADPVSRSNAGKIGGPVATTQKWISLIDGFISNPSNVARHNRSIGADPDARIKIDDLEAPAAVFTGVAA
ncbi:hypothetical protein OAA10_00380 [bacterium]|nr:hypothetical protein [bacterium]